jgi:hypothetical protein
MIINYSEFSKKLNGDLKEFRKELEECRILLKKISGFMWDSNISRFSNIYGTEFKFMLFENGGYNHQKKEFEGNGTFEISVWDIKGQTSIYNHIIIPEEKRSDFIQDMLQITERWTKGEVRCSDCKDWMSYEDNKKHHYFAGIYCDKCWDGKWKAIEAKENYE